MQLARLPNGACMTAVKVELLHATTINYAIVTIRANVKYAVGYVIDTK
jgi:hypothetical protein